MSTTYLNLNYFPIPVHFFETPAIELAEAQYGIKADSAICKLLCKIFKEGYYTPWDEEQAMIFARKLGGEINANEMNGIIEILLNKEFFDKESFEKHHVLTSVEIQRIWLEATSRRKRNLKELPFLLITPDRGKGGENSPKDVDILPENANISRQSIAEHNKAFSEEEGEPASSSFEIPGYAYNTQTHNLKGLFDSLAHHGVTNPKEVEAILKLSDYGRKGTQVWITLSCTKWAKIESPGRYILSTLKK